MSVIVNKVWDNFTRIYHLSQIILIALLWYSAEEADFESHFLYGFILLGLIIARLIWGIIGSQNSRFIEFVKMPWQLPKLYREKKLFHNPCGHNPIAGYMIIALIISLSLQLISGLFATDDVIAEGPLMYDVSESLAQWFDSIHADNFDILLILIGLHVVAAIAHLALKQPVIISIFTGKAKSSEKITRYWRSSYIALAIWGISFVSIYYFLIDKASF